MKEFIGFYEFPKRDDPLPLIISEDIINEVVNGMSFYTIDWFGNLVTTRIK